MVKKKQFWTFDFYRRWPVIYEKMSSSNQVKQFYLTNKGDDFCDIFAFYNLSIKCSIICCHQICQALINLQLITDFEVGICLAFSYSVDLIVWENPSSV